MRNFRVRPLSQAWCSAEYIDYHFSSQRIHSIHNNNFFLFQKGNLDFTELYTNTIELYHNSVFNESLDLTSMQDALCIDYLQQTIFPSVPCVQQKCRAACRSENAAMLSLALKSVMNPESGRKVS